MQEEKRCTYITKDKKQCSRGAKTDGFCTQHYKIHLKLQNTNVIPSVPKKGKRADPYEGLKEFPQHKEPKCFVCLEDTPREDDALFDCSYYVKGKGSCFVHHDCGKGLRKLECPGCRTPITTFRKIPKSQIEKHINEDNEEKRRLTAQMLSARELQAILVDFMNEPDDDDEDNEDDWEGPYEEVNSDILLAFALEYFSTYPDREDLHSAMHVRYQNNVVCTEIDVAIDAAIQILQVPQ